MPSHRSTDGVAWTHASKGMINVGSNPGLPRQSRFTMRVPLGDGFVARAEAKMRAHPKWLGLLVLVRNTAAAGAAAIFAASASDHQSSDAPAVAAGSETSAEAAVAGRESGASNHGAEPDGAGAGTGQAFDGAEPGVEHRRSARPSVVPVRFTDLDHAAWSEYDAARAGSRHTKVRESTYDELQESLANCEHRGRRAVFPL
eukprot:scaffold8498_cov105-Isochrysis_galbana.AAC.4